MSNVFFYRWVALTMTIVTLVLFFHIKSLEDQVESLKWKARTTQELSKQTEQERIKIEAKVLERAGIYFIEKIPVQIGGPFTRESEIIYPITLTGTDGEVHPLFKISQTRFNRDKLQMDMDNAYLILLRESGRINGQTGKDVDGLGVEKPFVDIEIETD